MDPDHIPSFASEHLVCHSEQTASPGCPLCHIPFPQVLENLKVTELAEQYRRQFAVNLLPDFQFLNISELEFCLCTGCDLRFFYPVITGTSQFYQKLMQQQWYYMEQKDEFRLAAAHLTLGDSVLDIGAGRGAFAENLSGIVYTGLDMSAAAVKMAAAVGVKVVCESVQEHARNHRNVYDAVCCFQTLEHVHPVDGFVHSALACLKDGGLFICSVPTTESFISLGRNAVLNMPPHHVTRWSDLALRNLARRYDLDLIELNHERLSTEHKQGYAQVIACEALSSILGRKSCSLLETSLLDKLLQKAGGYLGKFYTKGLSDSRLLPWGHSVTAIYRRKAPFSDAIGSRSVPSFATTAGVQTADGLR